MSAYSQTITCRMVAVISDIHSNYHAFQACFDDALLHGADCFIFLGDYVSDLADPVKTLDLVYAIRSQYPTICLRGNRERYILECKEGISVFAQGSKTGSLLYTFEQLRAQDWEFIRSLPIYDRIKINGVSFEVAHAGKDDDRYYFEENDDRIQGVFQKMDFSYMLTGHSHRQFLQQGQGKTIINPGSVGVPRDYGYYTQYALLDVSEQNVHCKFRQIPYNINKTIHAQFESGLVDCAKYWAVSILYDIMTGEEHTIALLERVFQRAGGSKDAVHDESLWHSIATEMGMVFTEEDLLECTRKGR